MNLETSCDGNVKFQFQDINILENIFHNCMFQYTRYINSDNKFVITYYKYNKNTDCVQIMSVDYILFIY